MNLINAALCQRTISTSERLLLAYLAVRANVVGVGLWPSREKILADLDISERTFQRLKGSLVESGLLEDVMATRWYRISYDGAAIDIENIDVREMYLLPQDIPTLTQAPPPPPPDPVKESDLYKKLIAAGIDHDEAYSLAEMKLKTPPPVIAGVDLGRESYFNPVDSAIPMATHWAITPTMPRQRTDDVESRFMNVWNTLHDKPPKGDVETELLEKWQMLEDLENAGTVEGETPAFELLYPAILAAARKNKGIMPMREFIDLDRYAAMKSPWDLMAAETTDSQRMVMQAEIGTMLREIEATGDPRLQVNPRTQERGDDGVMRMENVESYYRRVKAKYQQMLNLKAMGVTE